MATVEERLDLVETQYGGRLDRAEQQISEFMVLARVFVPPVEKLERDVLGVRALLERGLGEMNRRFEQIDKRFEQVDGRFSQMAGELGQVKTELGEVKGRLDQVDGRLKKLEDGVAEILKRLPQP